MEHAPTEHVNGSVEDLWIVLLNADGRVLMPRGNGAKDEREVGYGSSWNGTAAINSWKTDM